MVYANFLDYFWHMRANRDGRSCARASWTIQEIARNPGQQAALTVSLTGDGQTSEGQLVLVFDESRLSLPVTSGTIAGASANGALCARTSSNSVTILTGSIAGTPLPNRPTLLCTLPFSVLGNAQRGLVTLGSTFRFCGNAQGGSQTCTVTGGGVQVNAPLPAAAPQPSAPREVVVALASTAPRIDLLLGGFSVGQPSPIQALNTVPPRGIRRLVPERRGDALAYITNNPETPEAKLARFVVVTYQDGEQALVECAEGGCLGG